MPKVAIDFNLGEYEDLDPRLANRRHLNCWTETLPGKNTKSVVRTHHSYTEFSQAIAGGFNDAIIVDRITYVLTQGSFWSINIGGVPTLIAGGLPGLPARLVTNGKNVVGVYQSGAIGTDFTYDIGTTTFQSIVSLDPNYAGFGKALDVIYVDGYYLFITASTLFHGDNAVTGGGSGLTFNPLSFQPLPAEAGSGTGVELANSRIYVFTARKTYFYQVASTTPFSFARNTGFDLDFGGISGRGKITFDDRILINGRDEGSTPGIYLIEGSNIQKISDEKITEALGVNFNQNSQFGTYVYNNHRFVTFTVTRLTFINNTPQFCYDFTESSLRGYPVIHQRGWVDANSDPTGNALALKWVSTDDTSSSEVDRVYGFFVQRSAATTQMFVVDQDSTLEDPTAYNENSVGFERLIQYSFPFIRNNSDPYFIRNISLKWSGNVKEVQLSWTQDGENFNDLTEFDLETFNTKRAEWRRLGRFEGDVSFRVQWKPVSPTENCALIEGYFET